MTIITSPTEGDGRLCFCRRRYVGRYIGMFVNNFLAANQVSPTVTSDKFWKVKIGGEVCTLLSPSRFLLSCGSPFCLNSV